jgi:hypothetical protein
VVSVTDPYGRILGFLDRSRYFFFQVKFIYIFRRHRLLKPLCEVTFTAPNERQNNVPTVESVVLRN